MSSRRTKGFITFDLGSWLRSIGLEAYEAIFRENAIDVDLLHELTEDHLREMGLPLGVRLKLRKAINALGPFGEPISPAAALSTPVGETAERRHVTVLFSDLVGSTALSARMDAEDFREVIQGYHSTVSTVVSSHGGFVAKYMGDGALIYWGYPIAHEDDAERAVRAALALRDAMQRLRVNGLSLEVRSGLAT